MKTLLIITASAFLSLKAVAQEKLDIQQGNTLEYTVQAGGGIFPMSFNIDSLSDKRVELTWLLSQSKGRFIMNKTSLDSATECYWNQPRDFEELEMPATQNLLMISRQVFKQLKQTKSTVFDGALLSLVENKGEPFVLNGKPIDALYAESQSGMRVWILNNAKVPIFLKIENNPYMVDAILDRVKHNINLNK